VKVEVRVLFTGYPSFVTLIEHDTIAGIRPAKLAGQRAVRSTTRC
jgi:hypothetical protein